MPETGGFEENLLSHADFIKLHTIPGPALLRPDIVLYLASVITPLWQASERFLEAANMDPPFWAFAWPGSEALAAHIGACPALVRGKRVLDFAAGGGLAAIAAAKAGAARVEAADIDALAREAIGLNAALNGVDVRVLAGDVVGAACRWDVILCGDVCYEAPMARHILPWLRDCAGRAEVIIAEPGRNYAPEAGFELLGRLTVPTSLELEDSASREVSLIKLTPA